MNPTVRAYVLAEASRITREDTARLAMWRDGWRAACHHHSGDYETGFADGILAYKAAQHATLAAAAVLGDPAVLAATELTRWGPGGRARFADPRPGDYPGTRPR